MVFSKLMISLSILIMIDFLLTSVAVISGFEESNPLWKWFRYGQIIFMLAMNFIAIITHRHLVKYGFDLAKRFLEIFFVGMCLYYSVVLTLNMMEILI